MRWLQKEYGKALLCVVAHLDEAHPHLHFYAVPEDGQRFDSIHAGYRAQNGLTGDRGNRSVSKNEKADIRARGKFAYATAMREWQDRLQEDVGRFYGLARVGPRLQRVTRVEYLAGKTALQDEGKRLRELERQEVTVAALKAEVETQRMEAQKKERAARETQAAAEAMEVAARKTLAAAEQAKAAADRTWQTATQLMAQAKVIQTEAEAAGKAANTKEAEAKAAIASAEKREINAEKGVWTRIKDKLLDVFPDWKEALQRIEASLTQIWAKAGKRPEAWMDGPPVHGRKGPVIGD